MTTHARPDNWPGGRAPEPEQQRVDEMPIVRGADRMETMIAAQIAAEHARTASQKLLELAELREKPADLRTVVLNATAPRARDQGIEAGRPSRSIAIYNPTSFVLRLGFGGGLASAAARALPVPASSYVCLPLVVGDLDVALDDPTLIAAGVDAVVYVLRFECVQAPAMGNLL